MRRGKKARARKSSIAERWTRKIEEDEIPDKDEKKQDNEELPEIEKSDSQILATDSHDSEDRKFEEKRRQSYISRWASHDTVVEAKSTDLEEESDAGASFAFKYRARQRYINRWASKPDEKDEEESIPDSLLK